jgi:hypothetical protein
LPLEGAASAIVCDGCRDQLGIVDMPPARRPLAPCGKCAGTKLARVIPRSHCQSDVDELHQRRCPAERGLLSSHRYADAPEPSSGRGNLEAYVCRACGYIEWYCNDPENIPIGPELMTEEIDVGGGPYR